MATSWDNLFKSLFRQYFQHIGAPFEPESETRDVALTIDAVSRCRRHHLKRLAAKTPFGFFTKHNLIEFKSPNDPLNIPQFHRILSRAHLYAAENRVIHPQDVVICIICATRPTRLLDSESPVTPFTQQSRGVYATPTLIPCYVIVTPELPIEPVNYPLLVFTTGTTRKEFIQEMIARDEVELIKVARLLYPRDVKEGYKVAGKRLEIDLVENLRIIKQDVGAEELLEAFTPEERLTGLKPEERLTGLKPEERLAGLKPEELAQLREALNRLFPNDKTNGKKKRRKK